MIFFLKFLNFLVKIEQKSKKVIEDIDISYAQYHKKSEEVLKKGITMKVFLFENP